MMLSRTSETEEECVCDSLNVLSREIPFEDSSRRDAEDRRDDAESLTGVISEFARKLKSDVKVHLQNVRSQLR